MSSFPFIDLLVIAIALVTTIAWLGSIYYAASKGAKS